MVITFYNMTSPSIKINKTLGSPLKTTNASPQPDGPVNVVDPVLIVDCSSLPSNANYFTVGAPLNRSYFLVSIEYTTAKTAIVYGHSDVLSNFAGSLGTMNFVRGAGSLTEMDDASYPISDYMVEEYFPMTTWTDIFGAEGSGRKYLLRTVCSSADSMVFKDLENGNVFWDSNRSINIEGTTYYYCYRFDASLTGKKNFYEEFLRQDVQNLSQVQYGQYIRTTIGTATYIWEWTSGSSGPMSEFIGHS